ncbi:GMC family oxidoreductase [Glaciimonas immobilis]|uniref:Choline dehydrogenase n=1 Tax=Glaciimonas immobilis TaxID=728004 RepID=A0A840RW68_9BURK|nr:GMC family oxidoreductase N-terminal domain-containing protein [Glaciimonas immobilis]KAF3997628.1 twin-arginine translocation signal domain-containing protein [Glaciimonas immobilis]MBB5200669.1 choline dehydrogenase [Glaciimonas immobilis]
MKNNQRDSGDLEGGDRINLLEQAMMQGRVDRRSFMKFAAALGLSTATAATMAQNAAAIEANQSALAANLQRQYDYIICGAGSSGCVVASRLSENPDIKVLLIEAGGSDQVPAIQDPGIWFTNLGTDREWGDKSVPQTNLNNRQINLAMGKAIGGGSSINVMAYARGHKNDYDFWAAEAGDPRWNYDHVLAIYKRIEDWQGAPDPAYRGTGGNVWVQPANAPNPIAPAMVKAAASVGIPSFDDHNGAMMEGPGGCSIANTTIKDGRRRNMASQYLHPVMARPNLTILTQAEVQKITLVGKRATGVEFIWQGKTHEIGAAKEVILSTGALNSPKLLMLSGIGAEASLKRVGIRAVHHLPGVGQNFMDHILLGGCVWEYTSPQAPRNNLAECTFFWKSDSRLDTPDLQPFQIEIPYTSEVTGKQFAIPPAAWSIAPGLVRPASRGYVALQSSDPRDHLKIHANFLTDPADMKALVRAVELCREIGNAPELREFAKREVMPGPLKGKDMENFIRNAAMTYWHETGTCKMGRDRMAVVDHKLRVRGIEGLRVADGSIMPRVTTGNTMAPCMIIGERMAEILKQA